MGGQQKVLLTIAEGLMKEHDVTIYYENHNFYDLSKFNTKQPRKLIQLYNLIIVIVKFLLKGNFIKKVAVDEWHLKNLKNTLRNDEYDIVVLLNPYILFVDDIREILKSKKIVCWTHNLYDTYVNEYFRNEQKLLFDSLNKADQIVSLEKYTASNWKKTNENTIIIHNPVTINNDKISKLNNHYIAYVGRLEFNSKGLDYLCEVATKLEDDYKIIVAGSGKKEDEKKFKRMIISSGVSDKIILKGSLSGADLKTHFLSASAFLMTSRYEGFPLVSLEAMTFGLPFVGFDIPSLREVTEDGKYGKLIELGNTDEMAKYLNFLLSHDEERKLLSNLSKRRVATFSLENIIEQWNRDVFDII